ncbi:MAG TPA: GNAT family protein [Bryobacteraceae bacterium]|nr:GNAT family protein [Bryobacteraceae bacterium]
MIALRHARPDDLPYILALENQFADLGFVGSDRAELHERRMAHPDSAYLVIERDRRPFGFVILCGLDSPNRSIELKRIVVSEPGAGFGREALRLTVRMAFEQLSAHRLWLDVFSDNDRARRAYRAVGFIEEGTLRECVRHDDRFRSLVVMSILENECRLE